MVKKFIDIYTLGCLSCGLALNDGEDNSIFGDGGCILVVSVKLHLLGKSQLLQLFYGYDAFTVGK